MKKTKMTIENINETKNWLFGKIKLTKLYLDSASKKESTLK